MSEELKQVTHIDNVRLGEDEKSVVIIDQTQLPNRTVYLTLRTPEEMYDAIKLLQVRGAPAIGICAGYSIYALARQWEIGSYTEFAQKFHEQKEYLNSSRPTAVNLSWALNRMEGLVTANAGKPVSEILDLVIHTSRYYENTVISDTFYSHVIGALEESLRKEGYYMMLYAAEDLEEIFHMSLAWNVDGLIAITFKYHNYIKLKTLINKPIVAIDLIDKEAEDYVNVGLQDENGGYIMTKYLLEKGYEKIYVCARKNAGVDHERWMGYRKAWEEAGKSYLTNDFISLNETEQDRNKNYQMMMKFIGKKTALFFLSDMFAVEAIHYFQKQGVIIPDELGIAGFDGNILGKYCYPRLTTVYQDVTEKGKTAVKIMIDILENRLKSRFCNAY